MPMMSSSHSKDKGKETNNANRTHDRRSKSLRLSQKLRGLRELRSLRVSIDGGKPHLHNQRRESIQESPKEEEEYQIVHTPDRPQRFVSPVEAPTEDDCYDALRTWHYAAEQERSDTYGAQHRSAGEPRTDDDNTRSRGQSFVPDPNDELKTPMGERWWELTQGGAYTETGGGMEGMRGVNPFRQPGGDQEKKKQKQIDVVEEVVKHGMDKEGSLKRGVVPPNINTDFTGLLPKTYNPSQPGQNDGGINAVIYPSKDEYTPSVYSSDTPSQSPKSPATPTPEMFPKAPTGTTTSESSAPIAKATTAVLETLPGIDVKASRTVDSDNKPITPPPGGRYFDVDKEYIPSGSSTRKSSVSGDKPMAPSVPDDHPRLHPPRPMDNTGRGFLIPSLDFSNQTQTLHSELLKLAHKQQQQQGRKGSAQSEESGNNAFYSAFSSRPDTPDVRPPSRRGPGQQQQPSLSQGTHGTPGTGTATPATPRPKPPPKQTQQKRQQGPMTPPRFLKDRGPYVSPSGHPPAVPPKTPEKKPVITMATLKLNGQDFIPHRPPPPIPNQTPLKPRANMGSAKLGGLGGHTAGPVNISSLSSISPLFSVTGSNGHDVTPSRSAPSPTPTKPKAAGTNGMGGHIAGQVSISSLSSLALSDSGGSVITPPRFSPTKPKPPPPAPPLPLSLPGGDGDGLFTLPATVYSGNKKVKMAVPVTVPVPSPLSKFNTTHGSSSGRNNPSTSNRLPPQSQNQPPRKEKTQQSSPGFSDYLHPRISDPFVDSSPSSSVDDRFSIAMVNGVYNPGQAESWKETMAVMVQAREQEKEAQMQKPKLIRVQSQKRVKERVQGGQGKATTHNEVQEQPKVQKRDNEALKTLPGTPTPPPRTASPRYRVFPPQTQSQFQSQSQPQPQPQLQKHQQLQPAPSPSPHPSPSISLLRPIYPGPSRSQNSITPPPQARTITPPQNRTATPPRQHQPHPSFRRPSQDTIDSKQEAQQNEQHRPISVSSDSSDSSYESLKFWKKNGPGTKMGSGKDNVSKQQLKQKREHDEKKEKERKGRYNFNSDDDSGHDGSVAECWKSGSGKGKKNVSKVDDYEELIDQYAGGWRETMFFGEPEE